MTTRFVFDERFVEAFSHAEHVVLGQRLPPFSSWHELNLQLINSPLLTGATVGWADLVAAVRICATSYWTGRPAPRLELRGWREKLAWKWRMVHGSLEKEFSLFEKYLVDYASPPKLWPNQHKGQSGEGDRDFDEILESVTAVWSKAGCTEEEAWNMPIGALRWYMCCLAKLNGGDVQIWTPIHEQLFNRHKKKKEAEIDARAADIAAKEGVDPAVARQRAEQEYKSRADAFLASQSKK